MNMTDISEKETTPVPVREDKAEEIKDYLDKKQHDQEEGGDIFEKTGKKNKKGIVYVVAAAVLLLIAVLAYLSYYRGQQSFENGKVQISIETPQDIESGGEISLIVGYQNDNSVALKDVRMELHFPDNFIVSSSDKQLESDGQVSIWKLDNIAKNSTDKIRVYGRFIGDVGDVGDLRVILKYKPANFNSEFQAEKQSSIKISDIPVELSARFPEGGAKNDVDSDLTFNLKNKSSRTFAKAKIEIACPESFSLVSSSADPVDKDEDANKYIFEFSDLAAAKEETIAIKGNFHSENDRESIRMTVYLAEGDSDYVKYLEKTDEIAITRPGISVVTTINGTEDYVAGKNEMLEYKIDFENQSPSEIRGLTLKSTLAGDYDLTTIKADKGTVKDNEIVWSAAKVPILAQIKPGEKGSVAFKVKVKDIFTIEKEANKNFVLENRITMNTADQEIINLTKASKVRAFIVLETKGYFNDDGRITNGGSLPPKVGQKTYYTIHWSVRNLFNEVENASIKSVLPRGVKWTGKYITSTGKVVTDGAGQPDPTSAGNDGMAESITAERIFFDQDTNAVIWEIPKLKANDGILTSAKEIVFQIEVEPQNENVGKAMDIIDNITATGYDTFVQQAVTNSGKKVTTELFDDFSIGAEEAIVLPA